MNISCQTTTIREHSRSYYENYLYLGGMLMNILKRIINKRNLKAWQELRKEALRKRKKYRAKKDSKEYKYWDMVYDYYTRQCEKYKT